MTTGEPGTAANVVNSGTQQAAVLDFTIPQGKTGESGTPVELLSAYSTPAQAGTNGTALIFDRNALSYGTAVSHTAGSSSFTLNKPGVYSVAFQGNFAPGSGVNFPLSVSVSLQQGGSPVAGAAAQHTFHTSSDSANLSFTAPLAAASAPATLQVVGNGTAYLYGIMGITISRLGDIPTT
ncbi:hypothetical protein [uncultured Intestinimonas sp.]|uniref:hypothetical protein n=1 Tax=uncultured Intestinimonas sp. TaxID=1689265 RepID=UPI0025CDF76D|nr:hypothetical protein [uncultured Intestinimonas sp.]